MKEGEKNKKSKKWIILIVLVVIIAVLAFLFFKGIFTIPTGLMAGTGNEASTGGETPANPSPTFTTTGNEVIVKEITETLPYNEEIYLEPGRYYLEVVTDNPVWIRLYDKIRFDDWKDKGTHGYSPIGTGLKENEKTETLNGNFDINNGEGGNYYLLILGDKTTSIKFKIIQSLKF